MKPNAGNCACLVSLIFFYCGQIPAWGQEPGPAATLRIQIIQGEGAVNNVRDRESRGPIVEARNGAGSPVAGAAVTFFLPSQGPSGTFANGTKSLTVTTDAQGRAAALPFRLIGLTGSMQIRVTASFEGQTASAIITQTNVAGTSTSAAKGGMSSTAKLLIVLAVVGGAAAGGIAATHGGGGSSAAAPPPAITITPGVPIVGGPK